VCQQRFLAHALQLLVRQQRHLISLCGPCNITLQQQQQQQQRKARFENSAHVVGRYDRGSPCAPCCGHHDEARVHNTFVEREHCELSKYL
jgi:hypothetical protein